MPDNTVDLKGKSDKSYATYSHYSKLGKPLQYRYTASAMNQQRELLSHGVAAIILL
jgi:hypothetical protein